MFVMSIECRFLVGVLDRDWRSISRSKKPHCLAWFSGLIIDGKNGLVVRL